MKVETKKKLRTVINLTEHRTLRSCEGEDCSVPSRVFASPGTTPARLPSPSSSTPSRSLPAAASASRAPAFATPEP